MSEIPLIEVDWHSRLCLLQIKTYFPVYKLVVRFCQIWVKYHSAILQILGEIAFEKNCFWEHSFLQSLIGFHLLWKYYFIFPHKNMSRKIVQDWRRMMKEKEGFVAFLSNIRINRWKPPWKSVFIGCLYAIGSSKQIYQSIRCRREQVSRREIFLGILFSSQKLCVGRSCAFNTRCNRCQRGAANNSEN